MAEEEVPRSSSSMAVACVFLVLLVLMHLALCSRRLPAGRHAHAEKCADYFYEPLVLCRVSSSRHVAPGDFFGALDDEEFFVVEGSGGGGVAGSLTPR